MPSDKSTVATKADFVPTVVGGTDRERSIASSAPRAHDGTSPQPRPEVHQTQFNVLGYGPGAGIAGGASGGNGKKRESEAGGGQTGRDNETRSETNGQ